MYNFKVCEQETRKTTAESVKATRTAEILQAFTPKFAVGFKVV